MLLGRATNIRYSAGASYVQASRTMPEIFTPTIACHPARQLLPGELRKAIKSDTRGIEPLLSLPVCANLVTFHVFSDACMRRGDSV